MASSPCGSHQPGSTRSRAGLQSVRALSRIIALRFGGGLSGPEIAETTGLSLANVQQILSRSLRRMRSVIEEANAVRADPDAP